MHRSGSGETRHERFDALPQFLRAGDLLVLNDTRVLPARLALRKESGGQVEALWLEAGETPELARLMLSGGRLRPGVRLVDAEGQAVIELVEKPERGRWIGRSLQQPWQDLLQRIGTPPLPPYIRRLRKAAGEAEIEAADFERYQTIWAQQEGSVAAPTASLHFTPELLAQLEAMGVERTTPHRWVWLWEVRIELEQQVLQWWRTRQMV